MLFHQQPATYVETVHLKVKDLVRSLRFYEEILGFQVLKKDGTHVSLTADGQTPLVVLEEMENATPRNNRETGLFHLALLLPTRQDLGRFLQHLVQNKIPMGAGDHDVSEALYVNDPDGNGIEVYIDRHPDTWTWDNGLVFMSTEAVDFANLQTEGHGKSWTKLPLDTKMGHIHLQVNDLQASADFYTKGLGFDIVSIYGQGALFLSTNNYHHHIALNTWASKGGTPPSNKSVGLKAYTIVYPTPKKRQEAVEKVRLLGALVKEANDRYTVQDPAGNTIFLTVVK